MKTRIYKRGNNLVIRVPTAFIKALGLHANDEVEITVGRGEIVIRPNHMKTYSLDDLLKDITADNRPNGWDTEPAVGNEVW